jgi:hypothetical protein
MTTVTIPHLSVDLVAAAKRGEGPLAAMDDAKLAGLELHYRQFLALKREHPSMSFAPTGAIDAMWHLHMLHPVAYQRDCEAILGFVLDHNPGFGAGPDEMPALLEQFDATAALWTQEFGEPYVESDDRFEAVVMCEDKPKPDPDPTPKPDPDPAPRPPETKPHAAAALA